MVWLIIAYRKGLPRRKNNLLDDNRKVMQPGHSSIQTEQNYLTRVKQFCVFHKMRQSRKMRFPKIENFFSYLATEKKILRPTVRVPPVKELKETIIEPCLACPPGFQRRRKRL